MEALRAILVESYAESMEMTRHSDGTFSWALPDGALVEEITDPWHYKAIAGYFIQKAQQENPAGHFHLYEDFDQATGLLRCYEVVDCGLRDADVSELNTAQLTAEPDNELQDALAS